MGDNLKKIFLHYQSKGFAKKEDPCNQDYLVNFFCLTSFLFSNIEEKIDSLKYYLIEL